MFLLCSHPKLSQIHAPVAVNSVEKGVALMVEEGLVKVPKGSQTCMISSGFGMPAPSRLKASPLQLDVSTVGINQQALPVRTGLHDTERSAAEGEERLSLFGLLAVRVAVLPH
jgi:hypothetical protein